MEALWSSLTCSEYKFPRSLCSTLIVVGPQRGGTITGQSPVEATLSLDRGTFWLSGWV